MKAEFYTAKSNHKPSPTIDICQKPSPGMVGSWGLPWFITEVIKEGDPGDAFFIIRSGEVSGSKNLGNLRKPEETGVFFWDGNVSGC